MKILVPIDFTAVTENALKYAVGLTGTLEVSDIVLFHVVPSEKEAAAAQASLDKLAEKYRGETRASIDTHIRPGQIFDLIGKAALDQEAGLIVMGTHGIKGMQRLIGSRAMRVITNSQTPYIVVQHKPYHEIKKIMIPVDFTREAKQMLPLLQSLNERFSAAICLVPQKAKDEFISDKVRNNMGYFKSFLDDNAIRYEVAGSFQAKTKYKDVLREAGTHDVDLVVATIDPETDISDYIMGVEEQKIVANEAQIPVMCINIKHFMSRKGNMFDIMS
jgi:nucleotide-binding universal stress UspA family protein